MPLTQQIDGLYIKKGSDTENAIANMDGDTGSGRCVGYGICFTNRRSDRSYKSWKCGNNSYTNRCFGLVSVFSFLVFFYLQHMVFIFAAAIFLGFHLFHAALTTGMCFL